MFTSEQMKIIQYCATECEHQASGEVSVYDMLNAWQWASNQKYTDPDVPAKISPAVTLQFILDLGAFVEPIDNLNGFRTHNVGIRDINYPGGFKPIGSAWSEVERHLSILLESYYEGSLSGPILKEELGAPENAEQQFYFQYETIHPFGDGNGRTGKILYNYLTGNLISPIWPPNFFGGEHP